MNALIPLYREMADQGANFHGLSILQHTKQIAKLIKQHNVGTVLDFGCGRGDAYQSPHKIYREWGLKRHHITLYDPAFLRHDKLPDRQFDAVLCSDVLEHIPEDDIDPFLGTLFSHAKHVVWASVCTRAAKKFFPDGTTNLHVTVKPFEWWDARFQAASEHFGRAGVLVETP